MPAVIKDYANRPRRIYGDRLGFFRGVVNVLWITGAIAGLVALFTVLLTTR